jgi:hypothetical protein
MDNWILMFQSNVVLLSSMVEMSVKNYIASKHRHPIYLWLQAHSPKEGNFFNFSFSLYKGGSGHMQH